YQAVSAPAAARLPRTARTRFRLHRISIVRPKQRSKRRWAQAVLFDETACAATLQTWTVIRRAARRNQDDRGRIALLGEQSCNLTAVHIWKLNIQEHQPWAEAARRLQRGPAIRGFADDLV